MENPCNACNVVKDVGLGSMVTFSGLEGTMWQIYMNK